MKRHARLGLTAGIVCGSFIIAYGVVSLFYTQAVRSDFRKKQIFEFDLNADMQPLEIGPGDSFMVEPVIDNTATEEMYVFIEVDMPTYEEESLYDFTPSDNWTKIEEEPGREVYAYGTDEMIALQPGESTDALTYEMSMLDITNAEFSGYEDINLTIRGYGIDVVDGNAGLDAAWGSFKDLR